MAWPQQYWEICLQELDQVPILNIKENLLVIVAGEGGKEYTTAFAFFFFFNLLCTRSNGAFGGCIEIFLL